MFLTINCAVSVEETAQLLAFNEHKLYRTIVRRRICARQIYPPFSKSTQRVEVSTPRAHRRHAEESAFALSCLSFKFPPIQKVFSSLLTLLHG